MSTVFQTYRVVCVNQYGGMTRHTIEATTIEDATDFFITGGHRVIETEEVSIASSNPIQAITLHQ